MYTQQEMKQKPFLIKTFAIKKKPIDFTLIK